MSKRVAPEKDLKHVPGWNDFFGTAAALSVVIDKERYKT
jgi:hypothetical protein